MTQKRKTSPLLILTSDFLLELSGWRKDRKLKESQKRDLAVFWKIIFYLYLLQV